MSDKAKSVYSKLNPGITFLDDDYKKGVRYGNFKCNCGQKFTSYVAPYGEYGNMKIVDSHMGMWYSPQCPGCSYYVKI